MNDLICTTVNSIRNVKIGNYGRPVGFNRGHVSEKIYNRKGDKASALSVLYRLFQLVPVIMYRMFFLKPLN